MMKKYVFYAVLIALYLVGAGVSAKQYNEKYYQNEWCSQWYGKQEVKLFDGTRVDCVTKNYAVEFDFAKKWAECFGQAVHYSDLTLKKPACILIIEKPEDFRHYCKSKPTFMKHNVTLWYMLAPDFYEKLFK